jgi:hypothetical protein
MIPLPTDPPSDDLLQRLERLLLAYPGLNTHQQAECLGVPPEEVSRAKAALFRVWLARSDGVQTLLVGQLRRSQWRYEQLMEQYHASRQAQLLDKMRIEDTYQAKLLGLVRDWLDPANGPGLSADQLVAADAQARAELANWEP